MLQQGSRTAKFVATTKIHVILSKISAAGLKNTKFSDTIIIHVITARFVSNPDYQIVWQYNGFIKSFLWTINHMLVMNDKRVAKIRVLGSTNSIFAEIMWTFNFEDTYLQYIQLSTAQNIYRNSLTNLSSIELNLCQV